MGISNEIVSDSPITNIFDTLSCEIATPVITLARNDTVFDISEICRVEIHPAFFLS